MADWKHILLGGASVLIPLGIDLVRTGGTIQVKAFGLVLIVVGLAMIATWFEYFKKELRRTFQ